MITPEILLRMELYGRLYERTFGRTPHAWQVHAGIDEIIPIIYDGGARVLNQDFRSYDKFTLL